MRWDDFRRSDNVDDRRGDGVAAAVAAAGGFPMGGGGLGIGTIIVLGLLGWALGIDPRILIGGADILTGGGGGSQYEQPATGQVRRAAPYRRTDRPSPDSSSPPCSAATEDIWKAIFQDDGQTYRRRSSSCSRAARVRPAAPRRSAMGPFYCPTDSASISTPSFFRDLERRFRGCSGKACEFAQAYVIAHEVGHHVQNLLGILPKAQQAQQAAGSRAEANRIQVRVELQADCFAGVWANRSDKKWKFIEPGDVEAALADRDRDRRRPLQRQTQGTVVPDSLHARLVRAAPALVLDRPQGRQGVGLQHLRRVERRSRAPCVSRREPAHRRPE